MTTPHLTFVRVAVRAVAMLTTLALVNLAIGSYFHPDRSYDDAWRLPRTMAMSELPGLVEHIERASEGTAPVVAFVGASPTWGEAVANRHDTVPARWQAAARAAGSSARAFNLGANGLLPIDAYVMGVGVAEDADVVLVQVTYHTLGPAAGDASAQRYPELPDMLDVRVPHQLAERAHLHATPRIDQTGVTNRWLAARWRLYGERDALAHSILGGQPDEQLHGAWERAVSADGLDANAGTEQRTEAFDSLDPAAQVMMADEWLATADFDTAASDAGILALHLLAEDLRTSGVHAAFYLTPLNIEGLEFSGGFDRARYDRNVDVVRTAVEGGGIELIDMNAEAALPARAFADIDHTTADGSDLVARALYARTQHLLGGAR